MTLTLTARRLSANLRIKDDGKKVVFNTRVYNARKNYTNLTFYRELEKAGKLEILSVENATTENMLYGMSFITFTLKDNRNV